MKQIVTINTNHVCPMVTGVTPHIGGPIVGPGNSGILIDGTPVSVIGDTCICCGPPDVVVQGYSGVLADGMPITVQNCMTAHGGVIPMGIPGVIVSNASPVTIKHKSPKRSKTLAFLSGNADTLKEAIENQNSLQDQANEQEPMIYNVHWEKEDIYTNEGKWNQKVTVNADTAGFDEGDVVTFTITPQNEGEEGMESQEAIQLRGTVRKNHVKVEWNIEI
ncbi:MAG: PAAR domain-containing protein [Bacteroidales bacterium]